ncbi:MAG: polysaccharide deacetylase family protein [Pedobacter sp.]
MKKLLIGVFLCPFLFSACQSTSGETKHKTSITNDTILKVKASTIEDIKPADAATILARKEVPVLCYHQIREWTANDGKRAKDDIISPTKFKEHIKMLADSGYNSILPDHLYDYLVYGKALPEKPIMFTFDDTDLDQFTVAYPTLKQYGFKGVYFIMTVAIGKKGRIHYMNAAQIKELSDEGNVIASHTYDHKNFAKFTEEDWKTQIDEPTAKLERITGKKVEYFAYPYGVYKASLLPKLKEHGFKAAFILSTKRDENYPLYTIRRIIDPGNYTARNLLHSIKKSFK